MCDEAVVIDMGSGYIKAGFAGDEDPMAVFPSVVAHSGGTVLVGADAVAKGSEVTLIRPIENGIITNWEDMEHLWNHAFSRLETQANKQKLFLIDSPLNSSGDREKMAKIMFEKFQVPALHISSHAPLNLYANGLTNGVSVDMGYGKAHVASVYEGLVVKGKVETVDMGGNGLDEYFVKLLAEQGAGDLDKESARAAKEDVCYVAKDYEEEPVTEKSTTLSSGDSVAVGKARFMCPQALMSPPLAGVESQGVIRAAFTTITSCDVGIREELYDNVILAGGCSQFPGFGEHFTHTLDCMAPDSITPRVRVAMKHAAWAGGSIVSSMSTFEEQWVSKADFSANTGALHQKCK